GPLRRRRRARRPAPPRRGPGAPGAARLRHRHVLAGEACGVAGPGTVGHGGRSRAGGGAVPITRRRRCTGVARALLALLLGAAAAVLPASPGRADAGGPLVLVDVPAGTYYEPAVAWLLHEGLTTGVGGRAEFHPARPVSRSEAVTFLWRLAGSPSAPGSGFVDVPPGRWYSAAVGWARRQGITTGVGGSDRFAPHGPVTRAELAAFLWRSEGRPAVPAPTVPPFRFEVRTIDAGLAARMASSWRPGCPVPLS